MAPKELGKQYDRIAQWWHEQHQNSQYGLVQCERALRLVADQEGFSGGAALDVGCGAGGRFVRMLEEKGFVITGLDVSAEMIRLAKEQHPQHHFYHQDICDWQTEERFDFILAWDSLFCLPYEQQLPVLEKLCACLNPGGIFVYTFGDDDGWHTDTWLEDEFYYSSIGIERNIQCLLGQGMAIKHVELDQYPEKHVYIIASKI
ncbi:class I SAM-dependent methyltransferase [Pseudoteredinibacter isoporae]|uniref:2-polyprenyl-3-methyl-5-hydroxy-6-metoxy-1, 4-benzoquinol methylase n=1 Tax=Pseudoteredinibacter isoporae TaxID=570281 RepID=A0A7X0JY21_9GAMM|nr:class I SAM-dependent methyltransferase [Pseudoteredinibacter isoporae]MBB6523645.1 2-polyprenyl-3-methyl-5-hydroxy-6-metoxy-1,4-benzoquinol methylase [Pseudoteredinibacter isoporae]NHO89150.1 class I SAM-dependent methyltransferase [Pseudoteredinibacter isoporae]NIB22239.1 class I SAM-dependent methyltransferase [Pseudoteredinibacter isoporae]